MGTVSHGRVKRINAEFRGDEAVSVEILEEREATQADPARVVSIQK